MTIGTTDNGMAQTEYMYDPGQDTGQKRPNSDNEVPFQLIDRVSKQRISMKQVAFNVDICQGYADWVIHQ